jgi:aspartate/methionine/tyrosine aminotransferase
MNTVTAAKDIRPFLVMELLARARALEQEGRDIVHLEIGEPDFPAPAAVAEAGARAIRAGATRYTPAAGLPELRQAVADHYRRRYGAAVAPERIFITPGASGALLLALGAALAREGEVLLPDPGYPCYRNMSLLLGGRPRGVPLSGTDGFRVAWPLLEACWTDGTVAAVLASPANPTGAIVRPGDLAEIHAGIAARGGALICDEIYQGLEYAPDGEYAASACRIGDSAFIVSGFSKYFGMTGWRVGWLVAPETHADAVERLAQNLFIAAPTPSQHAALAALGNPSVAAELEARRAEFRRRRDFLLASLRRLGFAVPVDPQGAFYIYADCSRFTADSRGFALAALEEAGVAFTPGEDFGEISSARYARFAYTASLARLEDGVTRLESWLAARGG